MGRPKSNPYREKVSPAQKVKGYSIANAYDNGNVIGWPGEDIAKQQFYLLMQDPGRATYFKSLSNLTKQGKGKTFLYHCTRKALGADTKNYRQEIGDCFVAATKVVMSDGSEKNIEDIQVGEEVVTHKNRVRKVIRTISKKFTGQLYTIRGKGYHRSVTATSDHMFTTHDRVNKSLDWTNISLLNNEDYIVLPYGLQLANKEYVTFQKNQIEVDTDFARIIGLYLAEGGVSGTKTCPLAKVTFNLGNHEQILAEEVVALIDKVFNLHAKIYYHKLKQNVILVEIHNTDFAKFINTLVPGKVLNKNIPQLFFRTSKLIKLALIKGWLDGDGHYSKKLNRITGVTSSHQLLNDIHRLALSCELQPKSVLRKKRENQNVAAAQIDFYGESSAAFCQPHTIVRAITKNLAKYGISTKVKTTESVYVSNVDVYCLEVEEDHSFIANGYAVHNCVSFGAKNACEYLLCTQIALGNTLDKFRPVFPPYLYGCGRVFVGHQTDYSDGSVGSWQAEAVQKYGVLAADEPNVPAYAGKVAKAWGGGKGPPQEFVDLGKKHPVKSAAQVNSWSDLVAAVTNGYPCTVASNQGFQMEPGSDGFHSPHGSWAHQMCIMGVDDSYKTPYALILNSWGDVHGHLKDFDTQEDLPVGVLRVRSDTIESMIKQSDTFAFSHLDWFQDQVMPDDVFHLI
jgi:intein/homing endonuclease